MKVRVTFEAWDDYMTKLPTLFAGGAAPDLVHQHMSIVQDYGHRGALLDLAPLMERDGVDRSAFVPSLLDAFTDGGKVYGIPKDSAAWGIYYNKDKFDDAGVPYPSDDWTMEDLRATARALTRDDQGRDPDKSGFNPKKIKQYGFNWLEPVPTESENARALLRALGGDWYDEDYTSTHIDQRAAVEQFEMFRAMRCDDGSTPSPTLDLGQGDPFRSGLTAMTVGHHSTDFFLREEKTKFAWGVTFTPGGPGGQYVAVGCSGWAIAAGAKDQDGAWNLLKHLTSKAVQRSVAEEKRWAPSIQEAMDALIRDDPDRRFRQGARRSAAGAERPNGDLDEVPGQPVPDQGGLRRQLRSDLHDLQELRRRRRCPKDQGAGRRDPRRGLTRAGVHAPQGGRRRVLVHRPVADRFRLPGRRADDRLARDLVHELGPVQPAPVGRAGQLPCARTGPAGRAVVVQHGFLHRDQRSVEPRRRVGRRHAAQPADAVSPRVPDRVLPAGRDACGGERDPVVLDSQP